MRGRDLPTAPAAAAVALPLDELVGQPPARWQPVVLVGARVDLCARIVPSAAGAGRLVAGVRVRGTGP